MNFDKLLGLDYACSFHWQGAPWLLATDSRFAVVVNSLMGDLSEGNGSIDLLNDCESRPTDGKVKARALAEFCGQAGWWRQCSKCKGKGEIYCEHCEHHNDCDSCDGDGGRFIGNQEVDRYGFIGRLCFDLNIVAKALECAISPDEDEELDIKLLSRPKGSVMYLSGVSQGYEFRIVVTERDTWRKDVPRFEIGGEI